MKLFSCTIVILLTSYANAAVVVKSQQKMMGEKPDTCEAEMILDVNVFRNDIKCGKMHFSSIYNGKKNEMLQVNHISKTYMTLTEKDMQASGEAMEKQMKMMENMRSQFKNMPEAQRKMMEKAFSSLPNKNKPIEIKTTKQGGTIKVGKFNCQNYLKTMDGKKIAETCIGDWSQVGISYGKYKAIGDSMKKYWEGMRKKMPAYIVNEDMTAVDLSRGFMVQNKGFRDGKQNSEIVTIEIVEKDVGGGIENPPAGYTRQESPKIPDMKMPGK